MDGNPKDGKVKVNARIRHPPERETAVHLKPCKASEQPTTPQPLHDLRLQTRDSQPLLPEIVMRPILPIRLFRLHLAPIHLALTPHPISSLAIIISTSLSSSPSSNARAVSKYHIFFLIKWTTTVPPTRLFSYRVFRPSLCTHARSGLTGLPS